MRVTKKMLSVLAFMVLAFALFAPAAVLADDENDTHGVTVTIDGEEVEFAGQGAVVLGDVPFVPALEVFANLGFSVHWDANSGVLTLSNDRLVSAPFNPDTRAFGTERELFEIVIGTASATFTLNGEAISLGGQSRYENGSLLLPIGSLLNSIGHHWAWNENTNTLAIRNLWGFHSFTRTPGSIQRQLAPPSFGDPVAIIRTNRGSIHVRLFPDLAPLAVENFVTLARRGYYNGLLFHSVIDNFAIQSGCPQNTGFAGESAWGGYFGSELSYDLRHFRGALTFNNFGPNMNTSRFSIIQAHTLNPLNVTALEYRLANQDAVSMWNGLPFRAVFPPYMIEHYLQHGGTPHHDFGYTVFGQVYMGMDVVDDIASSPTQPDTIHPLVPIVIERIDVWHYGLEGTTDTTPVPGAVEAQLEDPGVGDEIAIIHTNHGEIHVRLFPEFAPMAVENFITHAKDGFYDGIIFHRILPNFMNITGDPTGTGLVNESIWGVPFGCELSHNLRHLRGALSMVNAGPHTNGSQFFIVQRTDQPEAQLERMARFLENPQLPSSNRGLLASEIWPPGIIEFYKEHGGTYHFDFNHTVFGQVFRGMDVVEAIAAVETGQGDRPIEDVYIITIEIVAFGG